MNIKLCCTQIRHQMLGIESYIRELMDSIMGSREFAGRPEVLEMHSHATLALRHAEDCGMRLGKVIQHHDGIVSIYDMADAAAGKAAPKAGADHGSEIQVGDTEDPSHAA